MSRLLTFFKDADTEFGVFYPIHYILAVFPNFADAEAARQAILQGGRAEQDVISASGEEVVQFAQDHLLQDGLW